MVGYGAALLTRRGAADGGEVTRLAFTPPPEQRFTNNIPGFGLSRDGSSIATPQRDTVFPYQHEYVTAHANYYVMPAGKRLIVVLGNPHDSWMVVRLWDVELKRRMAAH